MFTNMIHKHSILVIHQQWSTQYAGWSIAVTSLADNAPEDMLSAGIACRPNCLGHCCSQSSYNLHCSIPNTGVNYLWDRRLNCYNLEAFVNEIRDRHVCTSVCVV